MLNIADSYLIKQSFLGYRCESGIAMFRINNFTICKISQICVEPIKSLKPSEVFKTNQVCPVTRDSELYVYTPFTTKS